MLELFAIETGTNILLGIVKQLYAALKRFGAHSDDSNDTTQETPSSERRGGANNVQA